MTAISLRHSTTGRESQTDASYMTCVCLKYQQKLKKKNRKINNNNGSFIK